MAQAVWREMVAEAGIDTIDTSTPGKKKHKRSPKSHAVDLSVSPELRRGSHHVSSADTRS